VKSTESIIGSTVHIVPTAFLGAAPTIPGAYDFADTLVQIYQGSTLFEGATLGDIRGYSIEDGLYFDSNLISATERLHYQRRFIRAAHDREHQRSARTLYVLVGRRLDGFERHSVGPRPV
jgi:hypothetical protein